MATTGRRCALNMIGWQHALLGDHAWAVDCHRRAVALTVTAG